LQVGFSTADITPAIGMEMPGGYGKACISRIHDPLKARAAVFVDGTEAVVLVGLDTCEFQSPRIITEVRRAVEAQCGLPGDRILLAASHTHSGGPLFGMLPEEVADAPDLVKALIQQHSTVADPLYCEWVIRRTVSAICEAYRTREEATLSIGSGQEGEVAFNRRLRMANGRVYTHPGKGNPDILGPAGPIDPEVGVVAAWNARDELIGCVVNYACHATIANTGISADYILYIEKTIQAVMGASAQVVFLNGASGDVTQINNMSTSEQEVGDKYVRRVGTRIGAEALKVLVTAERGAGHPLAGKKEILTLQRRRPSPERGRASCAIIEECLRTGERTTAWTFAKEVLILEYLLQKQPEVEVEIQALQIGPAVFLANPTEYFCELGLDIKRRSPFPFTYIVGLANGSAGYVPTKEAFAPSGGGYETVLTSLSNLEIAAGDKIRDASLALACQLQPGTVSQAPRIEPPRPPWSYGMLGPDLD